MNAEKILTEVYWDLSPLSADQIKYPDHDTLRKCLKKYLNSRYGTIIAKEGKMAGFLNEQVQEWYKNNTDLLGVIEKLTKRCEKLEEENENLKKKVEELKAAYDNCVNECSDHVIEIDSLLQNLEVETVEQGIEKIKVLKDGCLITFNFSAEADLRVENEKLKKKIEDLRKDVKFEFDRRMTELAASTELKETVGRLRQKNYDLSRVLQEESIGRKRAESENTKLKSFIKGQMNLIHSMTDAIEQRLADLREEKSNE